MRISDWSSDVCSSDLGGLVAGEERVHCLSCGADYPRADGVGILVADPSAHEADLARAREVNPGWYLEEQPVEAVSPWRHHLRKRRLYVQAVLRREMALRGRETADTLLTLELGRWWGREGG